MQMISADGPISGAFAPGFEAVAAAFARNFTELGEVGASFCAVHGGRVVVDLHGGEAAPGRPWQADTLMGIFSGTKGLVAASMLMLIERGQIELDRSVADYWPAFAAHGKQDLPVRDLVCHRSGLPGITGRDLTIAEVTDPAHVEALLAAQPLSADPVARKCYHALTIGWLCGGLLRAVDGRSIGRFFADEIAGPLGLEVWIGLPEEQEHRVGRLRLSPEWGGWDAGLTPEQAADPTRRSIWANPPLFPADLPWNRPEMHAAEIPGGGAVATARSMARFYACLAHGGELDGVRLLWPETLLAGRERLNRFRDPFIGEEMAFGTVFALQTAKMRYGPPADAFGHGGAGGSIHAAWPTQDIGFSYVMNQMRVDPDGLRTQPLLEALYRAVA